MANNGSPTSGQAKKAGKSLKEKRAAKQVKQEAQTATRKAWEK